MGARGGAAAAATTLALLASGCMPAADPPVEVVVPLGSVVAMDHDPATQTLYALGLEGWPTDHHHHGETLLAHHLGTGETTALDDAWVLTGADPWLGVGREGELYVRDDGVDPYTVWGEPDRQLLVYRDGRLSDLHPVEAMTEAECAAHRPGAEGEDYLGIVVDQGALRPRFVLREGDDGRRLALDAARCEPASFVGGAEAYLRDNLQALDEATLRDTAASGAWWANEARDFRLEERPKRTLGGVLGNQPCERVYDRLSLAGRSYDMGSCVFAVHHLPSSGHLFTAEGDVLYATHTGVNRLRADGAAAPAPAPPTAAEPTPPAETLPAAEPAPDPAAVPGPRWSVSLDAAFWHSAVRAELREADLAVDEAGVATLTVRGDFTSLLPEPSDGWARLPREEVWLEHDGRRHDFSAEEIPALTPGARLPGWVAFEVDGGLAPEEAVLHVGLPGERAVAVPLAGQDERLVDGAPVAVRAGPAVKAGEVTVEVVAAELRGFDRFGRQVEDGRAWLHLRLVLDHRGDDPLGGRVLGGQSLVLSTPDGDEVAPRFARAVDVAPGEQAALLLGFALEEPVSGAHTLTFVSPAGPTGRIVLEFPDVD